MRKFRKKIFDDWVLSTLNYHPVSNLSKRYFLTSSFKKYLEKNRKNAKFSKFFFDDWVLSTLNYHPVSIWSIFNASKAFI